MELDRECLPDLEPVTYFEVNGDGERGDPRPPRGPGLYRVLVAGGSAAEGFFLDQASSWPMVLQARLSEPQGLRRLRAQRVHVGNVARSMMPCEAVAWMLREVLPRYEQLDCLILMVGASDVIDWLARRTPAELPAGRVELTSAFSQSPERRFGWNPRSLALRHLGGRAWHRLCRPLEVRRAAGARFAELRRMRHEATEMIDQVPDPRPMLEHFERFFRELLELSSRRGIRVVVIHQPWFRKASYSAEEQAHFWSFAVGRPYSETTTSYYTHRVANELLERVDALLARVCVEQGVEQLDVGPRIESSLANYYDFLHFTPAGARIVGNEIANFLLGRRGASTVRATFGGTSTLLWRASTPTRSVARRTPS
jgi:hypothetical protein